ncbi:uncharacterized protein LOC131369101 [Hemibagrus wyckioides]|uniref:uncharacterized protein LOC131369101 n=1 Tax=Hemibagrus wyckioides TaxID=337641 RepID=UPI00266C7615|nr:uncharacterized protein LOC131369101 [Hemibagrus wyckioides]
MRIQVIIGVLLIYTQVAMGSLFQDHVFCRFNQSNQCYVAVGQPLHLQMPQEDGFDLKTTGLILRYRKNQSPPPTPRLPRWQFVNDNKTMILTSAESSDSGTYTLIIFDVNGKDKSSSTLQVNTEARVSSVELSYSCLFSEVRKVYCSADGDNLRFNWTSDSITRLEDDNKTLVLDKKHNDKVTCHVENHVSQSQNSTELPECADFTIVFVFVWLFEVIILLSVLVGTLYIYPRFYRKQRTPERPGSSVDLDQD